MANNLRCNSLMKFKIEPNSCIIVNFFDNEFDYYSAEIVYDEPRYKTAKSRKQVETYYKREIASLLDVRYNDIIIPYDTIKEIK